MQQPYDSEVEVCVRLMRFADVRLAGQETPAVVVTTFLNGRMWERNVYNYQGEELTS